MLEITFRDLYDNKNQSSSFTDAWELSNTLMKELQALFEGFQKYSERNENIRYIGMFSSRICIPHCKTLSYQSVKVIGNFFFQQLNDVLPYFLVEGEQITTDGLHYFIKIAWTYRESSQLFINISRRVILCAIWHKGMQVE